MIQSVPHNAIHPSPLNPRKVIEGAALAELAASIKAEGLLQNLVVRPNDEGFEIAAGERRWRAIAQLIEAGDLPAGHEIPVVVRDLTDLQLLQLATTENLARADMTPLEEARAFARMLELGSDVPTIAAETGLSERTVRTRLALIERLAPAAIEALEAGIINLGQAQALTGGSLAAQERLVTATNYSDEPLVANLTAADVRSRLQREQIPVSRAKFPLERYAGEILPASIFDPEAEESFGDVDQFHQLQREYAEELRKEARRHWAWAEITDWFRAYDYDRLKGDTTDEQRAQAGVVIELDDRTGELKVHDGLVKRPARSGSGSGTRPERDPLALTQKHHAVINEHRTRALQGRVALDERLAATSSILGLMHLFWSGALVRSDLGNLQAVEGGVRQTIDAFRQRPGLEAVFGTEFRYQSSASLAEIAMRELLDMNLEDVLTLRDAVVAAHLQAGGEYQTSEAVDPATRLLWQAAGAEDGLPTWRELGADWLLMYPKARLEQVYTDATGREPGALTRKNLAAGILDHAKPGWLDQVPSELLLPEELAGKAEDVEEDEESECRMCGSTDGDLVDDLCSDCYEEWEAEGEPA